MSEKIKTYRNIKFSSEVIIKADNILKGITGKNDVTLHHSVFNIDTSDDESWSHDNEEEFFADYSRGFKKALFIKCYSDIGTISFSIHGNDTRASIALHEKQNIEKVFNYLESNVDKCRLPKEPGSEKKQKQTGLIKPLVKSRPIIQT